MKIMVAVKSAASLDEEFEFVDGAASVDPDYLEYDLNEWDSFSLEAALQIREAAREGEVVVITVGDDEGEQALLGCLARGADRAVRVWEEDLAEVGTDPLSTAYLLAAAIRREQPDLVLCGVQSSDQGNAAAGAAVAGYLDLPRVAVVREITYDAAANAVTVARELEGGLVERLRVSLPALLTVQTGINEPRYANLRAIKQARDKPMEVVDLEGIGSSVAEVMDRRGATLANLERPQATARAAMLEGDARQIGLRIAEIVKEGLSA